MNIRNIISKKILENTGLFDIRAFVLFFTIYSLISIWSANSMMEQDKKLDNLLNEIKVLKYQYVSTKTTLMNKSKYSNLLKKGLDFNFSQPNQPIQTIYLQYEH
tara:strand:+ start:74 stop:385 length:312 start_codon:yes stop_codon:yes gene_type:complete